MRSNWIQNGVRVTASDTGRLRTILPHPSNLDVVYILTSSGGLWKTTNFRQPRPRWTAISESLPSMAGGSIAFGASPETIYHGIGDPFDIGVGGAIFKSENGGQTWGAPAILSGASFVADLKVDTSVSPEVVLAGTNNGLFRSANAGATYTRIAGPISTTPGPPAVANIVWSLAKGEAGWVANVVTGGTRNGGLLLSADRGENWAPITSTALSGIARATLGVGVPGDKVVYAFAAGTTSIANPDRRSRQRSCSDRGISTGPPTAATVDNDGDGKPDVDADGKEIRVYTRTVRAGSHPIGIGQLDVDHVAIALNGARVGITKDGGETWDDRLVGPNWAGFNATVAWASNEVLYIGSESPSGVPSRIAKSQDGGETWTALPLGGLPNVPVTKLLVSPKDPNTIFAATWIGVYRSTDGGGSWTRYGSGLPFAVMSDLYLAPDGSFRRASSYGRGVWEIR